MISSSDDEDPLGKIALCDNCPIEPDNKDSHVDPVTLDGSRYRYTSQHSNPFFVDLEHRPDRVRD